MFSNIYYNVRGMRNFTRGLAIVFLIVVFAFGIWLTIFRKNFLSHSQIILPNIYIDNRPVGKLTQDEAEIFLKKVYASQVPFKIEFTFEKEKIAEIPANKLGYELPIKTAVDQAYTLGRVRGLSGLYQQLALTLNWEKYNFELTPRYDQKVLTTILEELNSAYKSEPVNARFDFQNNKVQAFQVDRDGFQLDTGTAMTRVMVALKNQRFSPKKRIIVSIPRQVVEAKIRLKDINNLGITELVAEGSSHFAGSIPERVHNIVTGAYRLNGQIIQPGQVFSFNEFLGEISGRTGFAPAYVIKNGKTVLDDGGGICQVSTTMFRAALNAGLPILERTAHAYRVGYYEQDAKPGLDATIYQPSVDLKFKNDYGSPLLIQAVVDEVNMSMSFLLYGKKDERVVEISDITLWNIAPAPPPEYVDDFSLPEGVTKQVDFAAPGASSKFTYRVTYPNKEVKEQEFISNFRPWKAIYLVGKKT